MKNTLQCMTKAIADILISNAPTIYLYGSCTMEDFRPGWSDIDMLVLTQTPIQPTQATQLLTLRQDLPVQLPEAVHARACEGGMLSMDAFVKGAADCVVYWGTSGQLVTQHHPSDPFCLWALHHHGRLLYGTDVRHLLPHPSAAELHSAVARHLQSIRQYGRGEDTLYAFGWLLDIARGLYTLRYDAVISKTAAGEWALAQGLCPDEAALRLALAVRREPALLHQEDVLRQARALTPAIQRFADVLSRELETRCALSPG